ncbi:hypothetical protein HER10_EVM0000698 [Colletotrichum scovillei]|uniref:Integral membrane protein n=1 Tax=Colletotrichum scovillei TaxID=1209932 RepID=A0A9P7UBI2_9PEZI|nr:uncharacterized protein HER10_EVM0000698 [Colletotrichum scovillei]KAF4780663.1 hypothetical protein HER10_EVM0000698 [Colletotrichum scovillei]KAG7045114.1 integral membrane protein [Colletotrichum scovillei]KAG7052276.1 integral membrane protein [Colletotrichum scovillei]KAG7064567.1 integral membrane protein [Colletotrichum scovillei]
MGLTDTPPPHVPSWVVPASGALLITGAIFWDMCYVLMSIRSHRTKSYGMPLFALALNLSWELIYAVRVAEHPFERLGFLVWLLLDVPLVYTTLKNAKHEWRHAPLVANNIGAFLAIMVALGCAGNYAVADWWLSAPGTGYGDKSGKWWAGREGFDCTELAFWTAGLAQFALGTGCLAMLLVRGHSGGASYAIWFCRALGTLTGWIGSTGLLWWYWPEAHGFFVNPMSIFLMTTCLACDTAYPFILAEVRRSEQILSDGRLVSGIPVKKSAAPITKKRL